MKKSEIKKFDQLTIVEKIKKAINQIRPALQMDGGDVQFVNYNAGSGQLKVELIGHCAHCPMSSITLKQGIEAEIRRTVPEVTGVQAIEL